MSVVIVFGRGRQLNCLVGLCLPIRLSLMFGASEFLGTTISGRCGVAWPVNFVSVLNRHREECTCLCGAYRFRARVVRAVFLPRCTSWLAISLGRAFGGWCAMFGSSGSRSGCWRSPGLRLREALSVRLVAFVAIATGGIWRRPRGGGAVELRSAVPVVGASCATLGGR